MAVENRETMSRQTALAAGPESFEAHFRALVLGSLQRSVAAESELQQALGHRLRARRAARRARELELVFSAAAGAERSSGPAAKRATRMAVVAAIVLLVIVVQVAGVTSVWTGAADVALIGVTVAWFLVDSRPGYRAAAPGLAGAEVEEAMPGHSG